ncbi:hypothetical protein [Micromonospora chersina]
MKRGILIGITAAVIAMLGATFSPTLASAAPVSTVDSTNAGSEWG